MQRLNNYISNPIKYDQFISYNKMHIHKKISNDNSISQLNLTTQSRNVYGGVEWIILKYNFFFKVIFLALFMLFTSEYVYRKSIFKNAPHLFLVNICCLFIIPFLKVLSSERILFFIYFRHFCVCIYTLCMNFLTIRLHMGKKNVERRRNI